MPPTETEGLLAPMRKVAKDRIAAGRMIFKAIELMIVVQGGRSG